MAKSMALNSAAGIGGMLKEGHKVHEGLQGAVIRNIEAAKAIAGMVQTSLGPNGMNKLVVNHLEKIIVSSDCATILKELEVQHPAAKMLVLASEMQESEFGDNTNFVSYINRNNSHLTTYLAQSYLIASCRPYFIFCLGKFSISRSNPLPPAPSTPFPTGHFLCG